GLAPDDVDLRWRVDECLTSLGRHRDRLDLLVELGSLLEHPDHKTATLIEAARVADEDLADLDRAVELYRRVLEVTPSDRFARAGLTSTLRRAGRLADVADARRAEATMAEDASRVARALREAADLLLERLDRPLDAAEVYRDLLARLPDDLAALRGLSEALGAAGDVEGTLAALDAEVDAQRD